MKPRQHSFALTFFFCLHCLFSVAGVYSYFGERSYYWFKCDDMEYYGYYTVREMETSAPSRDAHMATSPDQTMTREMAGYDSISVNKNPLGQVAVYLYR